MAYGLGDPSYSQSGVVPAGAGREFQPADDAGFRAGTHSNRFILFVIRNVAYAASSVMHPQSSPCYSFTDPKSSSSTTPKTPDSDVTIHLATPVI